LIHAVGLKAENRKISVDDIDYLKKHDMKN